MQTSEHRTTGWVLLIFCALATALNFSAGNNVVGTLLLFAIATIVFTQFKNRKNVGS